MGRAVRGVGCRLGGAGCRWIRCSPAGSQGRWGDRMVILLLVLWPIFCVSAGSFLGRATYDMLFLFLSRTRRWRRFDRGMRRLFASRAILPFGAVGLAGAPDNPVDPTNWLLIIAGGIGTAIVISAAWTAAFINIKASKIPRSAVVEKFEADLAFDTEQYLDKLDAKNRELACEACGSEIDTDDFDWDETKCGGCGHVGMPSEVSGEG
jgi:hypothetical protein